MTADSECHVGVAGLLSAPQHCFSFLQFVGVLHRLHLFFLVHVATFVVVVLDWLLHMTSLGVYYYYYYYYYYMLLLLLLNNNNNKTNIAITKST